MRSLSAAELIQTWERGFAQHPVDRALTLLAAGVGEAPETLAEWSIGRRDASLLEMHEHLFGPALDAFAECPRCREPLEYRLSTRDLAIPPAHNGPAELSLSEGVWSLRLRLINSRDLRAAGAHADIAAARTALIQRCIVECRREGRETPAPALPEPIAARAAACLAQADPQADVTIQLDCAACRHSWQVTLDIERFLWAKINALAKRLLREVHVLARAYGWRETDILALSATRRQIYLEMIRS